MMGIVEIAGAAILGGVLLQVGASTFGALRRRVVEAHRQRIALNLFREHVEREIEVSRLDRQQRELAWQGYRKFRIDRKVMEADEVCSFYLVAHDRMPIPVFHAGQYLTFRLNIRGQSELVTRCYSLSDSPKRGEYYRVTIKRLPPPRDKPDGLPGLASSYFHSLREGDLVDVRAPAGNFHLDDASNRPVVLIAGGIGLTPILSILNTICDTSIRRETWLFYGIENRRQHVMYDHFKSIVQRCNNVHIVICYSDPTEACIRGEDYHFKGRISIDLFKNVLRSNNYEFYICGPPPMMESVTGGLQQWGVPEADIHFEAFGPATVKRRAALAVAPGTGEAVRVSKIVFSRCGKTVDWSQNYGNILELAEKHGIQVNSGCRAGNCGTCETAVRDGRVNYLIETGFKPQEGSCLPCVAVPAGDVVLDA